MTDPSNICSLVTTAIRSRTFWGYAQLIETLAGAIDIQSSWAEGCSCHELDLKDNKWYRSRIKAVGQKLRRDATGEEEGESEGGAAAVLPAPSASRGVNREGRVEHATCKLKGRRAHEFATGEYERFVLHLLKTGRERVVAASLEVPEDDQTKLFSDWQAATDMIVTQTSLRSGFWRILPWRLAGMASENPEEARQVARECRALFVASTVGPAGTSGAHAITRRFFDPVALINLSLFGFCNSLGFLLGLSTVEQYSLQY